MKSDLVEAWTKNCKMNLILLNATTPGAMKDQYTPNTRTVAAQFAHMHNVRVMHLKKRGSRPTTGLESYGRKAQPTKSQLKKALKDSEIAMAQLFIDVEEEGKVKSWNGSPTTFLGYLISHEGHHRGLIMVCHRFSGTKLTEDHKYGIWSSWAK